MSRPTRLFFILITLILFCSLFGQWFDFTSESTSEFLSRFPSWITYLIFIMLYVGLSSLIWIGPKDVLRLTGALLFGPIISAILVYISELGNAIVLFTLTRKLGRGFLEQKMSDKALSKIDGIMQRTSFWWIFMLKFLLIVPLRFTDLAFGLTNVSLKRFLTISALALPVRILFVQYFLSLGTEVLMDPNRLMEHVQANTFLLPVCFAYVLVTIVVIIVWGVSLKKVSKN